MNSKLFYILILYYICIVYTCQIGTCKKAIQTAVDIIEERFISYECKNTPVNQINGIAQCTCPTEVNTVDVRILSASCKNIGWTNVVIINDTVYCIYEPVESEFNICTSLQPIMDIIYTDMNMIVDYTNEFVEFLNPILDSLITSYNSIISVLNTDLVDILGIIINVCELSITPCPINISPVNPFPLLPPIQVPQLNNWTIPDCTNTIAIASIPDNTTISLTCFLINN